MTETPREKREKLIMQWYEKKLNRDELLKVLEGSEIMYQEGWNKTKSKIIKNFNENYEKAKENSDFQSADAQYREIKKIQRKLNKKSAAVSEKKEEWRADLDQIDKEMMDIVQKAMSLEDGSWWKKWKLDDAKSRREKLDSIQKKIKGEIGELEREKKEIKLQLDEKEKKYGPKIQRKINKPENFDYKEGQLQELGLDPTLIGYREKYFQMIKDKEEQMQYLLENVKSLDLGVSEDIKMQMLSMMEAEMKKEIENLKDGDEITKLTDEIEKWLESSWKSEMEKIFDLDVEIKEKEKQIEKIESMGKLANTDKLLEIKEKEYEAKKELIDMKNNLESIRSDLSEKVKKYNGISMDWSKDMIVETWNEKLEREERKERERKERERKERERKEREDLKDFRKVWEERINNIYNYSKEKIIKAAENIPVKVETESDGSRLIEFKLGNKTYKILDPKLKTHSDDEYFVNNGYTFIRERDEWVKLGGMRGDDVNKRKNKKLKKYVQQKEKEGLHIAKIEEMKAILAELGEKAELDSEEDQIAMLMYLTGMDGWYWLSMGDDETSGSQGSRSGLRCRVNSRCFICYDFANDFASLCMIACN